MKHGTRSRRAGGLAVLQAGGIACVRFPTMLLSDLLP